MSKNIEINIGSDWSIECEWSDEGGAIDITGADITAEITHLHDADDVILSPTVTIDNAVEGLFTVSLSDAETKAVPEGLTSALKITINLGRLYKLPSAPIEGVE